MTLPDFLLFYTLFILLITLIALILGRTRDRANHWELSRPRLVQCNDCNCVFLAKRHTLVARCPRCNGVSSSYISH